MSVASKMTLIADKIRELLGVNVTMGLDAMKNNLSTAISETDTQAILIEQIKTALSGKTGSIIIPFVPQTAVTSNSTSITFENVPYLPSMFAVIPRDNIRLNYSTNYVTNVIYSFTLGERPCGVRSTTSTTVTEWNYTFTYDAENQRLTIYTNQSNVYFMGGVTYGLIGI